MNIEVARFRKYAFALLTGLLFMASASPGVRAQGAAVEGRHVFADQNPRSVETGKKSRSSNFSYGCPHCAEFEPFLMDWVKALPADVSFRRIPVMFQPRWVDLAKIFYTLEAMGEDGKLSPEVLQRDSRQRPGALGSGKAFYDWAATKGLDRKKVEDIYNSFAMSGRINRAKQLAQAYNVQEVPLLIIDGKFVTSPGRAGTHAATPAVMTELVAKARAERPKS